MKKYRIKIVKSKCWNIFDGLDDIQNILDETIDKNSIDLDTIINIERIMQHSDMFYFLIFFKKEIS